MIASRLLHELFDPMVRAKRTAIEGLRRIAAEKASRMQPWWAWTAWLAYAITARRIADA